MLCSPEIALHVNQHLLIYILWNFVGMLIIYNSNSGLTKIAKKKLCMKTSFLRWHHQFLDFRDLGSGKDDVKIHVKWLFYKHIHNIWYFDAPLVKLKQWYRGKLNSQGIYPWNLSMGIRLNPIQPGGL